MSGNIRLDSHDRIELLRLISTTAPAEESENIHEQ